MAVHTGNWQNVPLFSLLLHSLIFISSVSNSGDKSLRITRTKDTMEELCCSLHKMNNKFQRRESAFFSSFPGEKTVKGTGRTRPLRQLARERGRIQIALLISWSSACHSRRFLSHFLCACHSRARAPLHCNMRESRQEGRLGYIIQHLSCTNTPFFSLLFPIVFFLFFFKCTCTSVSTFDPLMALHFTARAVVWLLKCHSAICQLQCATTAAPCIRNSLF